jgi:hypothetical protein
MSIIKKLAEMADNLDARGRHEAADLIDDAIRKLSTQMVGDPYEDPDTGKWYQKEYSSDGLRAVEVAGPQGGLPKEEVAQKREPTWVQKKVNEGYKNWWQQATGQTAPGDPTPINNADDSISSYGMTTEKLDELISILQTIRMEMDENFGPEDEIEEPEYSSQPMHEKPMPDLEGFGS